MTPRNIVVAFVLVAAASTAAAAELVNINTADSATLQTLNGIGPSKAQAIIDYRTQHGPFTSIDQIKNVSGIGDATYAKIQGAITVGDTAQAQTQTQTTVDSSATTSASATTQTQTVGGIGPPPITARIMTDATAVVGAGTLFAGSAYGTEGQPLANARYMWNFGDGATAEGQQVWHTYAYPGTYDVELSVGSGFSSGTAPASVSLVAEGDGSLTVGNRSDYDLDIGGWSLAQGVASFRIPDHTMLLRAKGVRFAPSVLGFAGDVTATLYYPNGTTVITAVVGAQSPLRGQEVEIATSKQADKPQTSMVAGGLRSGSDATSGDLSAGKSPYPKTTMSAATETAAAAAAGGDIQLVYWMALVAIIGVGAVGTYYAHPSVSGVSAAATLDPADEFDIEE